MPSRGTRRRLLFTAHVKRIQIATQRANAFWEFIVASLPGNDWHGLKRREERGRLLRVGVEGLSPGRSRVARWRRRSAPRTRTRMKRACRPAGDGWIAGVPSRAHQSRQTPHTGTSVAFIARPGPRTLSHRVPQAACNDALRSRLPCPHVAHRGELLPRKRKDAVVLRMCRAISSLCCRFDHYLVKRRRRPLCRLRNKPSARIGTRRRGNSRILADRAGSDHHSPSRPTARADSAR
jgi:hypothetical protein